jgi:glyoxylase-like metal-dependent hydrolase (beta-lactamase superfamily II)
MLYQTLPPLLRGSGGAGFAGLIRTAYAVQAHHRLELADALAYWASCHLALPKADGVRAAARPSVDPQPALRRLHAAAPSRRSWDHAVQAVAREAAFEQAVAMLVPDAQLVLRTERVGLLVVVCAALLAACAAPERALGAFAKPAAEPLFGASDVEVVVLGIAQDGGVPHFGCDKWCCEAARLDGRALHPAALGVVDKRVNKLLLVEATPAIEPQVDLLHEVAGGQERGRQPVDGVLTTHAHLGHYLGLAWFGREVAGSREVPLHCSPRFADFVRSNAPWRQLVALKQLDVRPFVVGESFAPWPGLAVTPIAVPHRDEFSDTMAFVLQGPSRRLLFVPDVDAWEKAPGLLEAIEDALEVGLGDRLTRVPHREHRAAAAAGLPLLAQGAG